MPNHLPPPTTYAEFKERMRCLRALHNGSVTSEGRSQTRNESVGGVPTSYHLTARGGLAEDVVLDRMTEPAKTAFIRDAMCLGIRALDEGDHVHTQPDT